METKKLLNLVDHTCLSPQATWNEIKTLCDEGVEYETASACIPPSFVKKAKEYVSGKLKICTVIGFPNGYLTTKTKVYETQDAVSNGADEIDMVINLGWVKDGAYDCVLDEIKQVRKVCSGKILKVIIETCLLSEEEKIKLCEVVTESGADFIKTSTGFSNGGATFKDVELMRKHVGKDIAVKAAGGISSIEDAEEFVRLGATRLGTSRMIKLIKER